MRMLIDFFFFTFPFFVLDICLNLLEFSLFLSTLLPNLFQLFNRANHFPKFSQRLHTWRRVHASSPSPDLQIYYVAQISYFVYLDLAIFYFQKHIIGIDCC